MDPVTAAEVMNVLARAFVQEPDGDGRRIRQELSALIGAETSAGSVVSEVWRRAAASPGDPLFRRLLADALTEAARTIPPLMAGLARLARSSPRPADQPRAAAGTSGSHGNTIDGAARLYGPTVQARDVQGGIHIHAAPVPASPSPAFRPSAPRQLRSVPAHFAGRDSELGGLDRLLVQKPGSSQLLVVVSGPAGVGKTTLVSRWLHSVGEEFPDGQMYADLRGHVNIGTEPAGTVPATGPEEAAGPATPTEILGQFLRALGVVSVPADLAEQASLWRSVTAGLRMAVMLDNAFTAAQVRPLLPGGPDGLVVVTSRRRLTGLGVDGAVFRPLGVLDPAASLELLAHGVGNRRTAGELRAAREVVALCAGLPLALCVASARLASRPRQSLRTLADALARDAGPLTALEIEGEAAVRNALDASYTVLTADAARLYRRLGLLPVGTFDVRTAAAACGVSLGSAEGPLDELIEANLVEDIGPDVCRFHDLVRAHARDRAARDESESARTETLRRVCDWFLATVTAAEERLTPAQFTLPRDYVYPSDLPLPFADDAGALAWLDGHRLDLMGFVRTASDNGWDDCAWQLVDAAWPLFLRRRHYDLWIEAHELGLAAARRARNRTAERQMLNSGAIGLDAAGRIDDAIVWYEESLRAARAAGDVRDEGQALHGLGACCRNAGRLDAAVPYLTRAITAWESCGYLRGVALSQVVLGEIALAVDEPRRAVEYFTRAHDTLAAVKDPHDTARALAFLGRARVRAGEYAPGAAQLGEALAVFTRSGSLHWQARTLEMLGESAREHGDMATAVDACTRALALHEVTSPADADRLRDRLESLERPPAGPPPEGVTSE
ncbi:tetratricopeptide repeat protein [Streptomyces odonnellii]|uniref:tetratricopeptide repeat protein n=1 Tax=Streptomyces odonnellii TaxID=1417980 RepID=UPI000A49E5DF|nr:tetratricopeptide repeat protein [Streptomyces odonnellii]